MGENAVASRKGSSPVVALMRVERVQRLAIRWARQFLLNALIAAGGIIMLLPLIWLAVSAAKPMEEIFTVPITWIPKKFVFVENVRAVFKAVPFGRYYFNSVFVATSVTLMTLLFCSLAGFSFAHYHYPGRDALFLFVIATMMIPFPIVVIPLFVIVKQLGMLDSYSALIIPTAVSAFGVFLMRQFIMTIPGELIDAGRIDGCSEPMIFLRIVVPLIKPALASLAIFTFLGNWGSFFWPLVVIGKDQYRTLPLGLTYFRSNYITYWNQLFAASFLATVPVVIVFILFQGWFYKGMVMSGFKG
jgi:multiple sugar transport system permease protein